MKHVCFVVTHGAHDGRKAKNFRVVDMDQVANNGAANQARSVVTGHHNQLF